MSFGAIHRNGHDRIGADGSKYLCVVKTIMISEETVEKALDWLRDHAIEAAQARANRLYLEDYSKVIKAQLMNDCDALSNDLNVHPSIGTQEKFAYSHPTYIAHLQVLRTAIEQDEYQRFMRTTAEAKIEIYRSFAANNRAQGKMV